MSSLLPLITLVIVESRRMPSGFDPADFPHYKACPDQMSGNFIAILSDKASRHLGEACFNQCCREDLPAIFAAVPLDVCQILKKFPDIARADHVPFWEQRVPAITLTDTANLRTPYYHTESDTADKLNMEFAAKVCRATVLTVLKA